MLSYQLTTRDIACIHFKDHYFQSIPREKQLLYENVQVQGSMMITNVNKFGSLYPLKSCCFRKKKKVGK